MTRWQSPSVSCIAKKKLRPVFKYRFGLILKIKSSIFILNWKMETPKIFMVIICIGLALFPFAILLAMVPISVSAYALGLKSGIDSGSRAGDISFGLGIVGGFYFSQIASMYFCLKINKDKNIVKTSDFIFGAVLILFNWTFWIVVSEAFANIIFTIIEVPILSFVYIFYRLSKNKKMNLEIN